MDPSTQNTFLAQVNEAQVWTGEYLVPDLDNGGQLVPVREGIKMTTNKDGIRGIMQEASGGELTFHGKNKGNNARLVCPFGRTAGTNKKWADSQEKGAGTKQKGMGNTEYRTYSKRGTGCNVKINAFWKTEEGKEVVVFVWFGCL